MAEGRAAIYVDLLGYDEVSHHSGPERADTLAVLRDLDRQIGRIDRSLTLAPRPYRLVVLSDHGQTQGATFRQRNGETLAELVARLCGAATSGDDDAERGRTESTAWLRQARDGDGEAEAPAPQQPTVLGSGSLGLISLPGPPRRLTREEIDARHPALIPGLAGHPDIGFVLVRVGEGLARPRRRRRPQPGHRRGRRRRPARPVRTPRRRAGRRGRRLLDRRRPDGQRPLRPRARRGRRVRGAGRLPRRARRAPDPPVPAPPGRPVAARRADLHVGRRCTGCSRPGWPRSVSRSPARGSRATPAAGR